jgi:hypothetical protein
MNNENQKQLIRSMETLSSIRDRLGQPQPTNDEEARHKERRAKEYKIYLIRKTRRLLRNTTIPTELNTNLQHLENYYNTGKVPARWGASNGVPTNFLEKVNKQLQTVLGKEARTLEGGKRKTRRSKKSKKQTRRR